MNSHRKKIFVSWSGEVARQVATALASWIQSVNQYLDPWMSQDMDRGVRWMEEISRALESTDAGILCLTASNKESPWLHFEAGALGKKIDQSRVCPCLFRMSPADMAPPLSLFNATDLSNRDHVWNLLQTLNVAGDPQLDENVLSVAFEKWWPDLEAALAKIARSPARPHHARG